MTYIYQSITLHRLIRWLIVAGLYGLFAFLPLLGSAADSAFQAERIWPRLQQTAWYFNLPSGITQDTAGLVYVCDSGNKQIKVFTPDGDFVRSWGGKGSEAGQFAGTCKIAIANSGLVYVTDPNNHRVQVFTATGKFVLQWKKLGGAAAEFESPYAIAISSSGQVYVTDKGNDRIQVFNAEGQWLGEFGKTGSAEGEFNSPSGVAVDSDGLVYVADENNHRIQVFDSRGNFLRSWGGFGQANGQFDRPVGIGIDSEGLIYVAEWGNIPRVQVFSWAGEFIKTWGAELQEGAFDLPIDISISRTGVVSVVDADARVQHYTRQGVYLGSWQSQGTGEGHFFHPHAAVNSAQQVFVSDSTGRIQVFDAKGKFIRSWGKLGHAEGEFGYPAQVSFDAQGLVYVPDYDNDRIQVFTPEGKFLRSWGSSGSGKTQLDGPIALAFSATGLIYVCDVINNRIQVFNAQGEWVNGWGSPGSDKGQFDSPAGIAIASDGSVYVVDRSNDRIQVFNAQGQFSRSWGSTGSASNQFDTPAGIALSPTGLVYVADWFNNRIQVFSQDGVFKETIGQVGGLAGQLGQPYTVALFGEDTLYVAEFANNRVQKFVRKAVSAERIDKAIILAGGGPSTETYTNNIWDATEKLATKAWFALLSPTQGLSRDGLTYLSAGNTQSDLDGNGFHDDIIPATADALQQAISNASDARHVVLYLIDHGGPGKFEINDHELLKADDLNDWLKQLEGKITGKLTVIIESCRSGSFFSPLAKSNRYLVSSASADQPAVVSNFGLTSFSYYFWGEIDSGATLQEAFRTGRQGMSSHQKAQLDANADAQFTEVDYSALGTFCFGRCDKTAANPPNIIPPGNATIELGAETSASFGLQVNSSEKVTKVWGLVTRPNYQHLDADQPITDLPIIDFSCNEEAFCTGSYAQFDMKGDYRISVMAQDSQFQNSKPITITVKKTQEQAVVVAQTRYNASSGELILEDVLVNGVHYWAKLQDQGGFHFVVSDHYVLPGSVENPAATYDAATGLVTIPKVSASGSYYKVTLQASASGVFTVKTVN